MEALFEWFVRDILTWVIAWFTLKSFVKAQSEGKLGEAIGSLVIGFVCYFVAKNPVLVFDWGGEIVGKVFRKGQ